MPFGSRWFRWAKYPSGPLAGASLDTAVSTLTTTFVPSSLTVNADGTTTRTFTTTARNAAGTALQGKAVTVASADVWPSAANSTFVCVEAQIEDDGVDFANLRLVIKDASGNVIPDVYASDVTVSSSRGATDTIAAVDTNASSLGLLRYTVTSLTAGNPVFTAVVHGVTVTQTCTVEVTGTPSGGGTQTWGTNHQYATGSTDLALRDGGRIDGLSGGLPDPPVGEIVTAASVGLGTPYNVFKLYFRAGGNCMIQKDDAVPISTTHWGRMWVRNDEEGNKNDHPTAYHNIHGSDAIQAVPMQRIANSTPSGYWQISVTTDASYPNGRFYSPNLTNGVWYRFEWKMEYITATTFKWEVRVYSAAGTLLYTGDDFVREGGGLTLTGWMASNSVTLAGGSGTDAELARNFGWGNEGPSGSTDTGQPYYYANLAFSTTDWVGDAVQSWT